VVVVVVVSVVVVVVVVVIAAAAVVVQLKARELQWLLAPVQELPVYTITVKVTLVCLT
jgi:hypothetical protein